MTFNQYNQDNSVKVRPSDFTGVENSSVSIEIFSANLENHSKDYSCDMYSINQAAFNPYIYYSPVCLYFTDVFVVKALIIFLQIKEIQ